VVHSNGWTSLDLATLTGQKMCCGIIEKRERREKQEDKRDVENTIVKNRASQMMHHLAAVRTNLTESLKSIQPDDN